MPINTALGPIEPTNLGKTLMHEHLQIAFPGWESDQPAPPPQYRELVDICVDKIEELKSAGFQTLLDPCPNDLGRDVALIGEVAARTGFNLVFATGLYHHHLGGAPYWSMKFQLDPDAEERLTELFVKELTQGVGTTGLKAGVIKLSTAAAPFTDYEKRIFRAGAKASLITGAPITTHTDGVLGDEQLAYLKSLGVPAHRIIIGHCCASRSDDYVAGILDGGAYAGFDQFGIEFLRPDAERVASLVNHIRKGRTKQLIVSHDTMFCVRGHMVPQPFLDTIRAGGMAMRFTRVIAPMLKESGISDQAIDTLLVDNPRRYFAGEIAAAAEAA